LQRVAWRIVRLEPQAGESQCAPNGTSFSVATPEVIATAQVDKIVDSQAIFLIVNVQPRSAAAWRSNVHPAEKQSLSCDLRLGTSPNMVRFTDLFRTKSGHAAARAPGVSRDGSNQCCRCNRACEIGRLIRRRLGNNRQCKGGQRRPFLEDRFAQTKNADGKGTIASALVRLGDKDGLYWKYLTDSAASAIDADSPDILSVLSQDKSHPPPEMVAWAKAHNTSLGEATEDLLFDLPGRLISLAATGDPRAIPLFRRALLARNPLIQVAGAEGLAQIKDVASVPLIIAACKRGTADHAKALAMFSLIYFDDPDAQQAVDQYYSKKIADEMRKEIAAQKGPFN
jgi:hypothetical protein